jgi:hypothetical protein
MANLSTDILVTTYLEMRSADQLRPKAVTNESEPNLHLWRVTSLPKAPDSFRFNKEMYFRVGEQWRWIDKRPWTDAQWKEYANAAGLRTFAAFYDGALAGYYELRGDREGGVEIAYFGLIPEFIGCSLGGVLLTSAIGNAWRITPRPRRVWVHTCNWDHPQALANYQARGMVIYKVEKEKS